MSWNKYATGNKTFRWVVPAVFLLLFLHSLFIFNQFPSFSHLTNSSPIYYRDHALHYSFARMGKNFFLDHLTNWGYVPYFMAGFPKTPLFDASDNPIDIFMVLVGFLPEAYAYKFYIVLIGFLPPLLFFLTCRNFGFDPRESLVGMFLSMFFFWLDVPYRMYIWGMVNFMIISFLCPYLISLVYKAFSKRQGWSYLKLGFLCPLITMTHLLSLTLWIIPFLVSIAIFRKNLQKNDWIKIGIVAIVTILVNFFWIKPLFTFLHYKIPSGYALTITSLSTFISFQFLKQSALGIFLTFLGAMGLFQLWQEGDKKRFYLFSFSAIPLGLMAYGGAFWSVTRNIEPLRYACPYQVYIILPAIIGFFRLVKKADSISSHKRIGIVIVLVIGVFAAVGGRFVHNAFDKRPFTTVLHRDIQNLFNFLKEKTDSSGRVLVENSSHHDRHGKGIEYFGVYLLSIFPEKINREIIGGPQHDAYIQHGFVEFIDGMLFRRDIQLFSSEQIREYLNLYNISWIVCWSGVSRKYFETAPGLFQVENRIGKFSTFSVIRPASSFFYKGDGEIKADYNKIEINNIIPQDGEIIIKYHWLETLKTDPPHKIEPVLLMDDPTGFIRILDPSSKITVYNGY